MRRSSFGRRALLGGAGALLALPALESLMPRKARAADMVPRRLLAFYIPNGIHMAAWTPGSTGAGYALSPILAPLEPVKSKLLVLSGLDNTPSQPDGPGDHAAGTGGFLTCRHVVKTEGVDIQNGISVDQVAAAQIGQLTRIPSLQLGIDGGDSGGDCDSGYSCAYARNISWASATQPLPKMVDPQVVFDLLFAGFDPGATAAEIARRKLYKKSVLDYSLAESTALRARLGARDRAKLDEYMTGVSALEKKLQQPAGPVCEPGARPEGELGFEDHVTAMLDLMVVAMQCDATRVISFMLGNAGSNRSYPFLGVSEGHHEISHHQSSESNFAKLQTIDTWEVEQLAYLLARMDAVEEIDGTTMLDNSAVFFSSEIEDGDAHRHTNLPVLLAGGGGGTFSTGRHVAYDGNPLADLFTSMLASVDVALPTFGDNGTGLLPDLT